MLDKMNEAHTGVVNDMLTQASADRERDRKLRHDIANSFATVMAQERISFEERAKHITSEVSASIERAIDRQTVTLAGELQHLHNHQESRQ
jgi:hypothetical protein